MQAENATVAPRTRGLLAMALLLAAGVAVVLGVVGRVHHRSAVALPSFGFADVATFKSWLATVVIALAVVQLVGALGMYGRLSRGRRVPDWVPPVHRAVGGLTLVLSLPVAFYCLYAFGFAPAPLSARTLFHSVAGCLFYGAFAGKVLLVHSKRIPGWALPLAGAVVLTAVVVIWVTSALWWFGGTGTYG